MKCDFCCQEKPCEHVGYGLVACEKCIESELIKVKGGYAFKDNRNAMKKSTVKTKTKEGLI